MPNLSARLFGINLQHRLDGTEAFATQDCHLGPALPGRSCPVDCASTSRTPETSPVTSPRSWTATSGGETACRWAWRNRRSLPGSMMCWFCAIWSSSWLMPICRRTSVAPERPETGVSGRAHDQRQHALARCSFGLGATRRSVAGSLLTRCRFRRADRGAAEPRTLEMPKPAGRAGHEHPAKPGNGCVPDNHTIP
jgi:hypothetical protein